MQRALLCKLREFFLPLQRFWPHQDNRALAGMLWNLAGTVLQSRVSVLNRPSIPLGPVKHRAGFW